MYNIEGYLIVSQRTNIEMFLITAQTFPKLFDFMRFQRTESHYVQLHRQASWRNMCPEIGSIQAIHYHMCI